MTKYFNRGPVSRTFQRHLRASLDIRRADSDATDEFPWERTMHEKLGLLAFLHIRRAEVCFCDRRPIDRVKLIKVASELDIIRTRV